MIEFQHISHHYPGKPENLILDDISLTISKGECVGLTGPSGCGKSTLAKIGAGHVRPAAGKVLVNGRDLTCRPNREVFMIHQEPDLFPWQKVAKQVAFAMSKPDNRRVEQLLALVKLRGFENFYPGQLSGGMKKRLALARALAVDPELLILDESFSSLDATLKNELYEDLRRVWQSTGTTILLITHQSADLANLAHREIRLSAAKPTTISETINLVRT
ncbi:MAG: ATP-binding cassette domain-containing protein [Proteobacteria bacterium]|nr:ATP-binding cassette domain-containing protein [Pseudomonadota bacterium]MBU1715975.1 ATP-binding cassette domain-containing protein [Pseudomonadota bacterium]